MNTIIFIKTKAQLLILGFGLFFFNSTFSQTNLVPNPSFEQYTICPINYPIFQYLNDKPDLWFKPDHRYATYLNACSNDSIYGGVPFHKLAGGNGFQYARTGYGYVLMRHFGSSLNYFEVKLLDSLKQNKKYYGECYVNSVNSNTTACNSQSMYFSKNATYVDTTLYDTILRNPQVYNYDNPIIVDTLNWVKISGVFIAQGGEQYLTLGNFRNSYTVTKRIKLQNIGFNGAGYYYDDVSVYNLDSFCLKADAGKDVTIYQGDSAFIGSLTNGVDSLMWLENGTIKKDSTRPGFYVYPNSTTYYVLHQTINGCFSSDTVYVNVLLPLIFINYKVISSTEKSIQNIWTTANEVNVSHFNIQRSINSKDFINIAQQKAQNKNYNEYEIIDNKPLFGDSYYRIQSIDKDGKASYTETKKITINDKQQTTSIYPNPATTTINIASQQNIQQIKLINQLGQTLQQLNNLNTKHQTINIEQFAKGIYIVQITTLNGEIKTQKIVIN
jgi:hypothetical protein